MPETASTPGLQTPGGGVKATEPAMNMNEGPDSFYYEVIMPGIKREDIIVHVKGNIISVTVLPVQRREDMYEKQLVHEFDKGVMERNIVLPGNADPEFISAEYKTGVLKLHIPKTGGTPNTCNRQIIVY